MRNYFSANRFFFYTLGVIFFFVFSYFLFFSAPTDFPSGTIIKIEQGKSLRSVSLLLKQEHIIRSRTAFEAFVIIFGRERVVATDYYFENKLPVYELARRISKGEHHIAQIKITIPEGLNNSEIADVFVSELPYFNETQFLTDALQKQGNLFPDTYYFLITDNVSDVLESMGQNFEKKIALIRPQILSSGKIEKDVITMASIIEKEAKGDADRGFISGILWKRLKLGMPLQVDAAPETYKTKGLPKSPIGNPGLLTIEAAIHPQSSPYLYYLHDKDGNTHYAKTFAEHVQNKLKYLR